MSNDFVVSFLGRVPSENLVHFQKNLCKIVAAFLVVKN